LNYFRNGEKFPLASDQQAYWINGMFTAAGAGTTDGNHEGSPLNIGEYISTIRFLGGATGGDVASMEIDDIVYSNSLPDIRTIDGDAGWRMLASPMDGFDVNQLARQNLVQGVSDHFTGADPNIYTNYDGSNWVTPSGGSETLNRGEGFIWYLFDNANVLESKTLPFNMALAGGQSDTNVPVILHTNVDKWNLLGNPFSEDLEITNIGNWVNTGSLESNVAHIYNPADDTQATGDTFVLSSNNHDKIAAFQGFLIENNNGDEIVFPATATTSGATLYKSTSADSRLVSLKLNGNNGENNFTDRAFALYFHEDANSDWDVWDASKLTPLSAQFVNLAFVGERNGESRLKAQESRSLNPDEPFEVPVRLISAGVEGTFTLSIHKMVNLPDDWKIEFTDHETGKTVNLMQEDYEFEVSPTQSAKVQNSLKPNVTSMSKSSGTDRFTMNITPGNITSSEINDELPNRVALKQNFPNPFNPATQIVYELPQQSEVQLSVYDIAGRRIATLVNGNVQAGVHTVNFDASSLSSGVYIYRLETAQSTVTRRMTLIK